MKEKIYEKKKKFWKITVAVLIFVSGLTVIIRIYSRQSEEKIIGVIPQYNSCEFGRIKSGLEEETKRQGYKLMTVIPEEMTVQAQREAVSRLVKEGADCILLEAVAEGGFQDVLEKCSQEQIPVLAYNSRVNSKEIYAEVLPYPIESIAEKILDFMAGQTGKSGQFGVLSTTSQDYLREARTREMLMLLEKGLYPEIHFTGTGFVKEDASLTLEKVEQLGKKYPLLEYMICYSTQEAKYLSEYIEKNEMPWKMICEASLDEFAATAPEGTLVLTYDYSRYGRFLARLAAEAVTADQAPKEGETFRWEDDRNYCFTRKWEWESSVTEEPENTQTAGFSCITMQETPDLMIRENGQWK